MARRKHDPLQEALQALAPVLMAPDSPESRLVLSAALRTGHSVVAARVAGVVKERLVRGFEEDLKTCLRRFLGPHSKDDPGCKAKTAALEALDYLEDADCDPFLESIVHRQPEAVWGPPVDTATGLRSRAVLGLARQGHTDFLLYAGLLLADPAPGVRQASAEAVAHRGDPNGAALLLLRLKAAEPDLDVLQACLSGLLALAPTWGLDVARDWLGDRDEGHFEVAALALGTSRLDAALTRLLASLESEALPQRRAMLYRGLGLHRTDRALQALLGVIAERPALEAKEAAVALRHRCFEPGLGARMVEAARGNRDPGVLRAVRVVVESS